jgi:hypothetical protein
MALKLIVTQFITLVLGAQMYAQITPITGNVATNNKPVPDAIVEIFESGKVTKTITNESGNFNFKGCKTNSDTLEISTTKFGYLSSRQKIGRDSFDKIIFNLVKDTIQQLNEVIITGNSTVNKTNKSIYKINSKDFINNAKSDVALKSLPNVSISNSEVLVDGRKKAMIFIDGIESSIEEIKRLNVNEINKIEVISNPSGSFGAETQGAVIQVVTKVKNEKFFKGEIETYAGIRLNAFGILPSFAIKTKHITFKSFYSYGTNNQNSESYLIRSENKETFNQYYYRSVKGWQDYFSSRIKILINPNSSVILSGNVFRYKFDGQSNGRFESDNTAVNGFAIDDTEKLNKWSLSTIYNFNFNSKSKFIVKLKYFDYQNTNQSLYIDKNDNRFYNDIFSNTKEGSGEFVLEKSAVKLFKLPIEYAIGYKNIYRKFYFQFSDFYLNQNINAIYLNTDIELNSKFSMFASLAIDFTNNKNQNINQNYTFLLPTFSWMYKPNEKVNLKLDYSRKITRPSANYLNPGLIFFNPSYILSGNENLLPQLRDLYEISVNKEFKNENTISFKLFNEYTKNAIVETFIKKNNIIINTYENAGSVNLYGANVGLTTKVFKIISLNLNSGVSYNAYYSDSSNSLVKENKGYSFNGNLNLNTLIKKKISLTLNSNYNSAYYTLVSKNTTLPLLTFDAESTFLKDKLNLRLSYFDLFGLNSESINTIAYSSFNQSNTINNKMTNLTVTLSYNFGKSFSDRFSNPVINNDDIKIK